MSIGDRSVPRAVPGGLLGMLALVVIVELAVSSHRLDLSTPGSLCWRLGARAARREAPGCAVLCFGDSQVKFSVAPPLIERRTGRRAYNLALYGAPVPASYYQLRHALDAGSRPSALVIGLWPTLMSFRPQMLVREWPELLTFAECVELAASARDAEFLGAMLAARALPSVRTRIELRAGVLAGLQGESASFRTLLEPLRENWSRNRGAQVTASEGIASDPPLVPDPPALHDVHPINLAYLRRFLALAAERSLPVYWLLPPIHHQAQALRQQTGQEERLNRLVRSMLADYPNLRVVDGRHSGYDHHALWDPVHLNRLGATTLSHDLADLIARHSEGHPTHSRWAVLPAFRPMTAQPGLHEVDVIKLAHALK